MKCAFCHFSDTQVKDSRPNEDGTCIKRRRFCLNCGARFTTYERIETREIKVIKRNGVEKTFDRIKLLKSIEIAARKRLVNNEQLESIVSNIIKKLEKFGEGEVPSQLIGKLAMSELSLVDHVAYVRYASVYMDFSKPSDFNKFIKNLKIRK